MIPWEELDRAQIPEEDGELILRKRDTEYSIRTATTELMNSRLHGSEEALAELACKLLKIFSAGLGSLLVVNYRKSVITKRMGSAGSPEG